MPVVGVRGEGGAGEGDMAQESYAAVLPPLLLAPTLSDTALLLPGFLCKKEVMSAYLPSWPSWKYTEVTCVGDMEKGQELIRDNHCIRWKGSPPPKKR